MPTPSHRASLGIPDPLPALLLLLCRSRAVLSTPEQPHQGRGWVQSIPQPQPDHPKVPSRHGSSQNSPTSLEKGKKLSRTNSLGPCSPCPAPEPHPGAPTHHPSCPQLLVCHQHHIGLLKIQDPGYFSPFLLFICTHCGAVTHWKPCHVLCHHRGNPSVLPGLK